MRQGAAFQFIQELIGDYTHVMEMSENPRLFCIETAIESLHAAADVFQAIEEHRNTQRKIETAHQLQDKYKELAHERLANYSKEEAKRIDVLYEKVKQQINSGRFRDAEVTKFISCLRDDLNKVVDIYTDIQGNPDYPDRFQVEERFRKTLRDYRKLITLFIEEDESNG